jgi:HSF-type DNA-binding
MESPLFAHSIAAVDNETVWVEKKQRSRRTAKHAVSNRRIVGKLTTQALFKTAKNHTRLYVDHEYRDHAHDFDTDLLSFEQEGGNGESKRTNCELFPFKLHKVLTDAGRNGWDHVISWAPHGRCFTIHQPKEFVSQIIPR